MPLARLLFFAGAADELILRNGRQEVVLGLEALLHLLVPRGLQELALLDRGRDLSACLSLLASLLARVGDLSGQELDGADGVVIARNDVCDEVEIGRAH